MKKYNTIYSDVGVYFFLCQTLNTHMVMPLSSLQHSLAWSTVEPV